MTLSDAALVAPLGLKGPAFLHALETSAPAERIGVWLALGDALGAIGRWDRGRVAWERGLALAEGGLATRTQTASFYWRLGQLAEGLHELGDAARWYERAAEVFRREQALADDAVARMAVARVMFHHGGAGDARQHAREAVLAARDAEAEAGPALLGEALELAGEVALELGHGDEAIASFRDALRHYERARLTEGGSSRSSLEVRATVALAEALLDAGQVLQAVTTWEAIEGLASSHDSVETRGRGMALQGLMYLELGRIAEAVEPLKQAHEWFDAAGALMRRARLYVATARRIEQRAGAEEACPHYEKAWVIAKASGDELRLGPIGFALARCYVALRDYIRADDAIIEALRSVQNANDLEGLEHCCELAVRIAVSLAQGKLALERLVLLARTRGRLGDRPGELRTLRNALEAAIAVPDSDTAPIAHEFMEALRQCGTAVLGPVEAMRLAESMAGKRGAMPGLAAEIAGMEADRHVGEGRRSEAARTLARAAVWCIQAGDRWSAVELWDRALGIGREMGMAEVESWQVERTIASEG